MRSTAPTTVANRDLIQELSWQKLQYCTMAIRMAQHINMVYCNKERERELASSCWLQPFCTSAPAWVGERATWKTSFPRVICTLSCACTGRQHLMPEVFPSVSKHTFSMYSSSPFSLDGVLHCHVTPLCQCSSIAPAYLSKRLNASSYFKAKKKKNRRKKEKEGKQTHESPRSLLGSDPIYFKLDTKIPLHWKSGTHSPSNAGQLPTLTALLGGCYPPGSLQNRPAAQQKELFWLPKRGESWCSVIPPPVPIGEDSVGLSAPNALSENPFPIFPGWVKCRTELFSKCMSFPEISAALLKALRLMWFYQQHQWLSRLTQRLPGCMVELCSAAYCTLWHQTILLSQFTFPLQLKCRKCRLGRLSHNKQEWDLDADTAFGKKNLTEFTTFKPEP